MNVLELSKPLPVGSIDFRLQSINKGGYATILAYKDARVDMDRLDDVVGRGRWRRSHRTIDGQLFCNVEIYFEDIQQWVGMEDVGSESAIEKEKGRASDSFKRACFNWGIGRELYRFPEIVVKLNPDEFQVDEAKKKVFPTFKFRLKEWAWAIKRGADGEIVCLAARDNSGATRFVYGDKTAEGVWEQ